MGAIGDLFKSKKFWMTIIGSAVVGGMSYFGLGGELIAAVAGLFGVNIVGQGMADFGKEAD